jgi:hypothetical protein
MTVYSRNMANAKKQKNKLSYLITYELITFPDYAIFNYYVTHSIYNFLKLPSRLTKVF